MLRLSDELAGLPELSERECKALAAAGLCTVGDVLLRAPRRYEDRRTGGNIAGVADGDVVCLRVHVYGAGWRFARKRYFEVSAGGVGDPHGARLLLRWFNMPYVARLLAVGLQLSVYGRVRNYGGRLTMVNPDFEVLEEEDTGHRLAALALGGDGSELSGSEGAAGSGAPEVQELSGVPGIHTGRIVPVYRSVSGVSVRGYRALVFRLLQGLPPVVEVPVYDAAPAYPFAEALWDLHFPREVGAERKARLRFALQECFVRQFRVAWRRARWRGRAGQVTAVSDDYVRELLGRLPFRLTEAQLRCVREIREDMSRPVPMNRLLQGDVGSGKTLVALCAMLLAYECGKCAALLAPTQILAQQHYHNFCRLLEGMDVRVSLRTGERSDDSMLVWEADAAADAGPRLIVGTHALLYKRSRPQNLGLAVIDEQHKFGVEQRERFISSGENPDVLVMTATPIPRTLTLTLYGDLDVSVIDELPARRGEVVTVLRHPDRLKRLVAFMRSELEAGRQIYIVAPLIEEGSGREQASATAEFERWQGELPGVSMGLLHGRLSAEEKDSVMAAFSANEVQVLVATTVVEVGVDVPNATMMLINDADSFGLSQLHQLRGRIGRGCHRSYCVLLSRARPGEPGRDKLEVLCRTQNGFEIAEEDFRLRGPGDVLGTAQSGLGAVDFPEWLSDMRLVARARREAEGILAEDPELSEPCHAALRRAVAEESGGAVVS